MADKKTKFDPDAYLASDKSSFDPDAYLADEEKEYSTLGSLGMGGIQGITFDLADEGYGLIGAIKDKYIDGEEGDFSEHYQRNRDQARAEFDQAREDNTAAYYAGDIGAGFLIPGGAAKNIGKMGLKQLAIRGAGQGALAGFGSSEGETTGDVAIDTLTGGAIGATLPTALVGTGKLAKSGANAAKKVIPGFEGSLGNKPTAKLASITSRIKGEGDNEADLYKLLSDPEYRRNLPNRANRSQALEELSDEVFDTGTDLKEQLTKSHTKNHGKWIGTTDNSPIDEMAYGGVKDELKGLKELASSDEYKHQFDPSFDSFLDRMDSISKNSVRMPGDPKEMMPSAFFKETLHHLRQEADAYYQRLEAKGGTPATRDSVLRLRNYIDESIKGTTGGDYRKAIDDTHTFWKQEIEPIFKKVVNRDSGKVDYQKVATMFRESTVSSLELRRKMASVHKFAESNPEAFMTPQLFNFKHAVEKFTKLMEDKQFLNRIGYGSGPSGHSVNILTQLGLGYITGGASTFLTPIIDPVRWTQIIDRAVDVSQHPWVAGQIKKIGSLGIKSAESINRAVLKDRIRSKQEKSNELKAKFQQRQAEQKAKFIGEKR